MYRDSFFLDEILYKYILSHLVDGCSAWLVDTAYALTDIYDHISQPDKAVTIAEGILDMKSLAKSNMDFKTLRMMVGCAYSIAIAKEKEIKKKEENLEKAKRVFDKVRTRIDVWDYSEEKEKHYLEGLYESDLGAYYLNLGILEKEKGNITSREEAINRALEHHRKGERIRKDLLDHYVSIVDPDYEDCRRRYFQSKSNVAFSLFELKKYDEALSIHREVLDNCLSQDISNAMFSKRYIVGCLIELAETKGLSYEQMGELTCYIAECKNYYKDRNDEDRLEDILKIEERINRLNTDSSKK